VSSPEFEFQLQILAGQAITPNRGMSEDDIIRLSVAKRTLDQNYMEIDEYVDGDLLTNPMFICHQNRREEEGFETLRLLHNYLSSVYSFNETVRVLFNQCTPEDITLRSSDFTAASGSDSSYYTRKLTFLRGLRTDFQHGGFSCLTFEKAGVLGDFGGYHIIFNRETFMNDSGLRDPNRFLRHTNEREQRQPLCFLSQFHQTSLQNFYNDTESWFNAV
jgi:hypothetical protein